MNAKVINPYPFIGVQHKATLDFIIANLPASPTFENLNEIIAATLYPPDPLNPLFSKIVEGIMLTVLPHAYNGYVNGWTTDNGQQTTDNSRGGFSVVSSQSSVVVLNTKYTEKQQVIINQMLEGINRVPVESIADFLRGVEEEIVSSGLSYEEQVPLFVATASGISEHEYWTEQITTPGTWAGYLNTDPAINYMHLAGWVSASMQGALLTYGLVKPPQVQPLDVFSALVGGVGLVAGKVVFGWYAMQTH